MRSFDAKGCNDAFVQLSQALLHDPEYIVAPRGEPTREITNVAIIIGNPLDRLVRHPARSLSLRYLAGEFLWYERGSNSLAEISHYASFWNQCSDDGTTVRSSYGARLLGACGQTNQWQTVRDELIQDRNSRRATLLLLQPSDVREGKKDVPCTIGLQFLIRDDRLHLSTWMRSNDLFLGFCYDAAIFTLWQEKMLRSLQVAMPEIGMGTYTHFATSMHVYGRHFSAIEQVAQRPDAQVKSGMFRMPEIADVDAIATVQPLEQALRTHGRSGLAAPRFADPFADWLARCLYEG